MKRIIITIDTVNEAFQKHMEYEITQILRSAANQLSFGTKPPFRLYDANGNYVGDVEVIE